MVKYPKKSEVVKKRLLEHPESFSGFIGSTKGTHRKEETKEKIRQGRINWFINHPEERIKTGNRRKGTPHTKEANEKNRVAHLGEKSPLWQGGVWHDPYSVDWTLSLKKSIRERDHYICQLCGAQQEEEAFSVHHIDYNKQNCSPDNLITLCHSCHEKTNLNREYWTNYFQTKIFNQN
jgi:formylmethanofuran dehydrogenase subunit E